MFKYQQGNYYAMINGLISKNTVFDNYGRPVTSLRIQLNAICNFNCFFCHMEGTERNMSFLTPENIEKIVEVAASHGVNKVKFTGGEPTLRNDILEIIRRTRKHINGSISMTTNGVLLPILAVKLKDAGLDRVNISMHSNDDYTFEKITNVRRDYLDTVKRGIQAANNAGLTPVKVNFVVLKGINEDQIDSMINFCAKNHAILQLIEFETSRGRENSGDYLKYHVSLEPIEEKIKKRSIYMERNELHNRERYILNTLDGEVKVEFVKPMHNKDFCKHCTRLRVTADGNFKTCLLRENDYFNIKDKLNNQRSLDEEFIKAVKNRIPYWR
jgi:cyclic pyranopterin phosphate synthase